MAAQPPIANGIHATSSTAPAANGTSPVEAPAAPAPTVVPVFSWLGAHPIFVILLVGPAEIPFGIQKDFLCSRSAHYRKYFETQGDDKVEHIVKIRNTDPDIFGHVQHYLYTGDVFPASGEVPTYETLIGVWKLGHDLAIDGLCDAALEAMIEFRRRTDHIPATPLLVQVWRDTPEGSSIRKLLLSWAAEYMRSSDARTQFAKSLPQEVLSELVVAMSSLDSLLTVPAQPPLSASQAIVAPRKNVHYLDVDDSDEDQRAEKKLNRRASGPTSMPQSSSSSRPLASAAATGTSTPPARNKPGPKPSSSKPGPKPKRRSSGMELSEADFSPAQKVAFCSDLLTRMLSGPGFWTRLVRPFKFPVDPSADNVPDYHEKIKQPMDLTTIKDKMDNGRYTSDEEFFADMELIFSNCFTYWKKSDPMWEACEKFQKTFYEKYGQMKKWLSKMEGDEAE